MKNTLKGKMVKTDRPKVSVNEVNCECLNCLWEGNIKDTKTNNEGDYLCPDCLDKVIVYEN